MIETVMIVFAIGIFAIFATLMILAAMHSYIGQIYETSSVGMV
jgi:hypothetical protein